MKPLNLNDPDNPCCGALLDKGKAQERIDQMQRIIDTCHQYINYGDLPEQGLKELKKKLELFSSF